jgi:hypothetical protein
MDRQEHRVSNSFTDGEAKLLDEILGNSAAQRYARNPFFDGLRKKALKMVKRLNGELPRGKRGKASEL